MPRLVQMLTLDICGKGSRLHYILVACLET